MNIPLSPLSPLQSLGWLDPARPIRCLSGIAGFTAGKAYAFRQFPIAVQRAVKRPSISGPDRKCRLTARDTCFAATDDWGKERLFVDRRHLGESTLITTDPLPGSTGDPPVAAGDSPGAQGLSPLPLRLQRLLHQCASAPRPIHPHFALDVLVEHFEITPPPDIAKANPDHIANNLAALQEIEQIVNES